MTVAVADELLDDGAASLRFFDVWLPLHRDAAAVVGRDAGAMSTERARSRYDEQRGMSFSSLEADAEVLRRVTAKLERARSAQAGVGTRLAGAWQGEGGRAANAEVGRLLGKGDALCGAAAGLARAYTDGAKELREQVRTKSEWVRDMDDGRVAGHEPESVQQIIAVAGGDSTSSTNDNAIVAVALDLTGVRPLELIPSTRAPVIDAAHDFLDRVFMPAVEQTWREYLAVCDEAHEKCLASYATVAAASVDHGGPSSTLAASSPGGPGSTSGSPDAAPVHSTAVGWLHPEPVLDLPPRDTPAPAATGADLASVAGAEDLPAGETDARLATVDPTGPMTPLSGHLNLWDDVSDAPVRDGPTPDEAGGHRRYVDQRGQGS